MSTVTALLAAAIGMAIAVLADLGSARLSLSRATCYIVSLIFGILATLIAVVLMSPSDRIAALAIAVLAYGSWWYAFINLVQSLESSLRVRLLGEIRAAGGSMSVGTLQSIYNDSFLLRLRLERLITSGAVIERDGRLFVNSRGLVVIACTFNFMKMILLGRLSEFERPIK